MLRLLAYLCRGNPNMNSLVGLGAVTSFAAGLAAPLVPGAALEVSFLEEPVMLLSFVLLGRALEARARLKASGAHSIFWVKVGQQCINLNLLWGATYFG